MGAIATSWLGSSVSSGRAMEAPLPDVGQAVGGRAKAIGQPAAKWRSQADEGAGERMTAGCKALSRSLNTSDGAPAASQPQSPVTPAAPLLASGSPVRRAVARFAGGVREQGMRDTMCVHEITLATDRPLPELQAVAAAAQAVGLEPARAYEADGRAMLSITAALPSTALDDTAADLLVQRLRHAVPDLPRLRIVGHRMAMSLDETPDWIVDEILLSELSPR